MANCQCVRNWKYYICSWRVALIDFNAYEVLNGLVQKYVLFIQMIIMRTIEFTKCSRYRKANWCSKKVPSFNNRGPLLDKTIIFNYGFRSRIPQQFVYDLQVSMLVSLVFQTLLSDFIVSWILRNRAKLFSVNYSAK